MRNILVTGGAGYIGIHTSILLLEKGFNVITIDSLINSSLLAIDRLYSSSASELNFSKSQLKFLKGDVRDVSFLRKVFLDQKISGQPIDIVIHFAGLKAVQESILLPDLYWDNNVNGTIKLLKVMEENECRNIVFSSSATVYSLNEKSPLNESSKLLPVDPYGKTKLTVENILKGLLSNSNSLWKIISLRYFNPIGAHSSGLFGESPVNTPNNLFPYICEVANNRREVLSIFGNDWPTRDGTCIRDFIHIMDLSDGHLAAINFINKYRDPFFKAINLGTGKGTSVLELVKTFELVNNLKINYVFAERRPGDKGIVFANSDLAKDLLKWEPKRNIINMCKDGWNWQLNNPEGYQK